MNVLIDYIPVVTTRPLLPEMELKIALADDQQLFLKSLSALINTFQNCTVVADALNGEELLKRLRNGSHPEVILLDVNMPVMDGVETARAISASWPDIKLAALSMKDDDTTIISMLKAGCCAYLLKDIHPDELEKALHEIKNKGYYNGDVANIRYRRMLQAAHSTEKEQITDQEMEFLKLACSELTYKQIASQMNRSERTVDGYRESMFRKLNVQSRVGMAMEAIRRGLVVLSFQKF